MKPHRIYGLVFFRIAKQAAIFLPRPVFHKIAELIGRIIYASRPEMKAIMRENLGQVSGLKGKELDRLCLDNAVNFAIMIADYFLSICSKPEAVRTLLAEWRGLDTIKAALARGKGVILVTAHLGHWELGAVLLAMEGLPMNIVTAREPSQELNEWRERYREKLGIKTITVGEDAFAFMEVINALKRNEIVAMLVDRPAGNSALPVQFCGRKTFFSNGPALLCRHTEAAVIPAFVLQDNKGRYVSFADPEIPMEQSRETRAVMARNTQKIASIFEELIRKHPDQWHNYVRIWTDEK
jgi:KDO2-lipid IV(A) lauroyltransferase